MCIRDSPEVEVTDGVLIALREAGRDPRGDLAGQDVGDADALRQGVVLGESGRHVEAHHADQEADQGRRRQHAEDDLAGAGDAPDPDPRLRCR